MQNAPSTGQADRGKDHLSGEAKKGDPVVGMIKGGCKGKKKSRTAGKRHQQGWADD